jgi:hypothetical protein
MTRPIDDVTKVILNSGDPRFKLMVQADDKRKFQNGRSAIA